MTRQRHLIERILSGASDTNVRFSELCGLLDALGFKSRARGSHHIYWREGVAEILNLAGKVR